MTNGNGRQIVNFERLEDEMRSEMHHAHHTPVPPLPDPNHEVQRFGTEQYTALQVIGHAITRLTWKDAEKVGAGIQVKMKEGVSLAAAIQGWAEEWEKFDS